MPTEFHTPDWVRDAVFYQIFPDRFAASTQVVKPNNLEPWDTPPTRYGFKGGDLLGATERLDYLQDLGVTAVYFTPIFQSASNHRYHTHDYFRVDPLLGGDAAFHTFLKEAHRRNMRVVLDGVFNHASRGFFQFNHLLETGASSPYVDWWTVRDFPLNAYEGQPNYEAWIGLPALPKFNTNNPQVRQFIFSVARYWIEQGIDGWRLDVPNEIRDDSFWQEFRQVVKGANPEAYITGEIVVDARHWVQGDQFDAVMNYMLTYACWAFFGGPAIDVDWLWDWGKRYPFDPSAQNFARGVDWVLQNYPAEANAVMLNLIDSHDTPRFLTIAKGNKNALRLAMLFLMTFPGAPCVYYGDEIGLDGGHDPECRKAFPWNPQQWDHELRTYYQRIISLRHAHPALRRGSFRQLAAANGAVWYLREGPDERLLVGLNPTDQTVVLDLPAAGIFPDEQVLQDLLGTLQVQVTDGLLGGVRLNPYQGVVLAA